MGRWSNFGRSTLSDLWISTISPVPQKSMNTKMMASKMIRMMSGWALAPAAQPPATPPTAALHAPRAIRTVMTTANTALRVPPRKNWFRLSRQRSQRMARS